MATANEDDAVTYLAITQYN